MRRGLSQLDPRGRPYRHSRKAFRATILTTVGLGVFLFAFFAKEASAQLGNFGLEYVTSIGLPTEDIRVIVARIIRNLLGLLGLVAVVIILYGGFVWMTSGGEESKITQAKDIIKNGVIGLAIMLLATAITQFIITQLIAASLGGGLFGGPAQPPSFTTPLSGALGAGPIESHFPPRNAPPPDIPRNTNIVVTFKMPIDPASVIEDTNGSGVFGDDGDRLNAANVKIIAVDAIAAGGIGETPVTSFVTNVAARITPDNRTVVFDPEGLLGSPSAMVRYAVRLTSGITDANGAPVFPPDISGGAGYEWRFDMSTFIDLTPPQVDDILPRPCAGGGCPRNALVQVNFNEPVDPTSVSGIVPDSFSNITVRAGDVPVAGEFRIVNQYLTVEFVTADLCGTNSCGGDVFCLPGGSDITVTVKAATLGPEPPSSVLPYDGVVDMAANSLDGNRDSVAQGPEVMTNKPPYSLENPNSATQGDDVVRNFRTSNLIDLNPPTILSVDPGLNIGDVSLDVPVTITWSKLMSFGSLSNATVGLDASPPALGGEFWYGVWNLNLDANGDPPTSLSPFRSRSEIRHAPFFPSLCAEPPYATCSTDNDCDLGGSVSCNRQDYWPGVTSGARDLYQNCFFPGAGPGCSLEPGDSYCCNGQSQPSDTPCSQGLPPAP
ncbi:MAG: hypothetical protein AAB562_02380 [Patescibacteria group bacterium]